mgnify:FL=1
MSLGDEKDMRYHAEAYNNLGLAYYEQGRLDGAIEAYNKAIKLNPDYVEAYCGLGLAYSGQGTD